MCIELALNFFARQTDNSVVNMESVKILVCFFNIFGLCKVIYCHYRSSGSRGFVLVKLEPTNRKLADSAGLSFYNVSLRFEMNLTFMFQPVKSRMYRSCYF